MNHEPYRTRMTRGRDLDQGQHRAIAALTEQPAVTDETKAAGLH